jgi:hypothetical protein
LRWSGLQVFDRGTAELENCIIERALTAIHPFDVVTRSSGVVTVRNCTITDGGTGIYDYRDPTAGSLTVENTTFRNLVTGIVASPRFNAITGCRFENLQVAIRLLPSTGGSTFAADDLNRISNNTYINNAVNIVFGGHTDFLLKASLTLPSSADGQPLALGSFRIRPNTALTVPAGATVLMERGAQIIVEGGLQAVGTADAPIRFVPIQPTN